ncbi:FAD-binding oxidoreductase [Desulfobacula sp.]|uniref:NAD(P)/FAD-dependent oxidoreductase n=1 Tax=Desulfobacula sp. TaxID=2593537 RepID=UPI00261AB0B2|nr:FAD-binding oxidoreductase [Desulfobacula sp.]
MKQNSPQIVIIGGGVIGTSIAYHLAKQDACVTLIEKNDLASGSSGACDGLVFMQSKKPGVHLSLAMESLNRFESLQRELPIDIEFKKTGGMVIIETDAEYRAMEKFTREQQAIGLDVRLLDQSQALEKEPFLSPSIMGSTFSPLDAQVNPISLTLGLALAAKKNHARVITHAKVLGIHTKNNRVTGVATTQGNFDADMVVNAAGSMAGRVSDMVEMSMPVQPRRGQIVVTHAGKPVLTRCLISAKYIAAKYDPSLADKSGQGISMEQADNGNLLLGSTREFVGFNRENTLSGIKKIIRQTAAILPVLENFQVIRSFAGLRPYTPDGLPILGPVRSLDGFFMAAGHEGDGIALSPITGDLMARMLLGQKIHIPLDAFSPDRFGSNGGKHHD